MVSSHRVVSRASLKAALVQALRALLSWLDVGTGARSQVIAEAEGNTVVVLGTAFGQKSLRDARSAFTLWSCRRRLDGVALLARTLGDNSLKLSDLFVLGFGLGLSLCLGSLPLRLLLSLLLHRSVPGG